MDAYLMHGRLVPGGPMIAEQVPVKEAVMPHQARGLTWTASGYGERVPTRYMVQVDNRWRRVYCCITSNNGTLFIGRNNGTLFIGRNLRTGTIVELS